MAAILRSRVGHMFSVCGVWVLGSSCDRPEAPERPASVVVEPAANSTPAGPQPVAAVDIPKPSDPAVTSSLELPPWSAFQSVVKRDGWGTPAKASNRTWLDNTRAVAAVRTRQGEGEDAKWRVTLVRLSWDGNVWATAGTRELENWFYLEEIERDGTIAVNLRVDDVDDDGTKEMVARFRLNWMCCGAGATAKRTLVILNDDESMSEAAYVDLDESIYRGGTTGRERFEDRDGDGHRDLVVTWKASYEGEPEESGERVHAWTTKDRYKGARRPRGEECICD